MAKGFMDGYRTYDTSKGFGRSRDWKDAFEHTMGAEEAAEVIREQPNTPWGILGVVRTASQVEIKKAFRKLIAEWHPDHNPHRLKEAGERSRQIIAAYTILSSR